MRSCCVTLLALATVTIAATACGGTHSDLSKQEAIQTARRIVGLQRGLGIEDVLERTLRGQEKKAWLIRFEVRQIDCQGLCRRPAQQCVLVWRSSARYRFPDPDVEFNPLRRVGRSWVLQDDCAKVEHIVGPLPPSAVR